MESIPWVVVFCYEVMNLKRITTSHWTGPRIYVLFLANIRTWFWSQTWETKHVGRFSLFSGFLSLCTYCKGENTCNLFIWQLSSLQMPILTSLHYLLFPLYTFWAAWDTCHSVKGRNQFYIIQKNGPGSFSPESCENLGAKIISFPICLQPLSAPLKILKYCCCEVKHWHRHLKFLHYLWYRKKEID